MQQTLDISNDVAAELASIGDSVLDALREQLDCKINLRGNRLTIDGGDAEVEQARAVIDEIVELVEGGHEIGSGTVDAVVSALDKEQDIREVLEDVVWRHRGKKVAPKTAAQKEYVDTIRTLDRHLRDRPGRDRQDLPRDRARRRRALGAPGRRGSSSRVPRSRPASGSASSPATCSRRSTRTCARSSTRSTT